MPGRWQPAMRPTSPALRRLFKEWRSHWPERSPPLWHPPEAVLRPYRWCSSWSPASPCRSPRSRSPSASERDPSAEHVRDREPVPALARHRLDGRRLEPRIAAEHLEDTTRADDVRVVGVADDAPATYDVVDHDERPGPRQGQRRLQIGRVVLLVGVDEDEVVRVDVGPDERGQGVGGEADHHLHPIRDAGQTPVLLGHCRCPRIELQGGDAPLLTCLLYTSDA